MSTESNKLTALERQRQLLERQLAQVEAAADAERVKRLADEAEAEAKREQARGALLKQEAERAALERTKRQQAAAVTEAPIRRAAAHPPPIESQSKETSPIAPAVPPPTPQPPMAPPTLMAATAVARQAMVADETGGEDARDEPPRFSLRRWLRNAPPVMVSTVFHSVALIVLGLLTLAMPEKEPQGVVMESVNAPEDSAVLEEMTDVDLQTEELPELEDISVAVTEPVPGMVAFSDVTAAASAVVAGDTGDVQLEATTIGEIGALFGDQGQGMSDSGEGTEAAATFFGAKSTGSRFVFVVDNSNSMGRGKFETVLEELVKSVDKLTPKQRFYVYFFSDRAYPLFHPDPPYGMVRATPENKRKLKAWLYNVEMCLRTQGREAMEKALKMRPDAIYVLGDGSFTDATAGMLTAPHDRFTVINTIGMQVNEKGRKELQEIAAANKGTFRSAQPSAAGTAMARANPIKRNNKFGPIWGTKLPKK